MKYVPDEIERVARLGWHCYPMLRESKAGCFKGAHGNATDNLETLDRWAYKYPDCNWRVVCGPSRLFALDVDHAGETHEADGFKALQALVEKHGPIPPRPMTRTGGSGGAVLFFRHNGEELRGASGSPAPGLDPHRNGQAIVIPPSVHPVTGGAYTWRRGYAPWEIETPPIPAWLADLLKPPPEPKLPEHFVPTYGKAVKMMCDALNRVQDAPSGAANDTLNRQAYRVGRWCGAGVISTDEAYAALLGAADGRGIPLNEARATIRSGLRSGVRNPVERRG